MGALVAFAVAAPSRAAVASALPRPAHTIVIVEENKTFAEIVGNARAPYINALAKRGALFTHAFGVTHPSLPNYLALFSGLTNDNGDDCPATGLSPYAPNLASELLAAHFSFAGYAENLPAEGSTVCAAGTYARKHAPWVAFKNVPASLGKPFSALPSYDRLPTVAFVVPDVDDDMHDGSIAAGDDWLREHLSGLVAWANSHDALIVLTWDEGYDSRNTIPTILFGPMVKPGAYSERIDHYTTLRTIEDLYGLAPTGHAKEAAPLRDCFRT
jgi:acid phosphatase